MDNLNDAFDTLGIETEDIGDTHEKLSAEAKEADISINDTRQQVIESGKLFYGLSAMDRDQAVLESVVPKAYRDACFNSDKIKENIRTQYKESNKLYKVYRFNDYVTLCNTSLSTLRMKHLPD